MEMRIPHTPLIGRGRELDLLRQWLSLPTQAAGNVLVLSGEAGIGKSRLADEAVALARDHGLDIARAGCYEEDHLLAYAPLLDLLRALSAGRSAGDLRALLGSGVPLLVRLDPHLGGLFPEAAPGDELDPEDQSRRVARALAEFIVRSAAGKPLLIILEDLHWADDPTLNAVRVISRRLPATPARLLLSYRADEAHDALQHLVAYLRRERLATELNLTPLDRDQVGDLVRALLGPDRPIRDDVLDGIHHLTDGNPFFVEEVLGTIGATEVPSTPAGVDSLPGDARRVPSAVQDAVKRRCEHLTPDVHDLLLLAAAIGRRFDFELLQRITAQDEGTLLRSLRALVNANLVVEEEPDRFAFRHELTRAATLSGLLTRERRDLHRRIAAALTRQGDTSDGAVAALAHHAFEASMWPEALANNRQAGRRAMSLNDPRAADEHFGRAIVAAQRLAVVPPVQLFRARGEARETLGNFDFARADYEAALELAEQSQDRRAEWQILIDLGFLWASRDYLQARTYFEQALASARDLGDQSLIAHSLNRIGNWLLNAGQPKDAVLLHEQALNIFETEKDEPGLAQTLDLLGLAYSHCLDLLRAVDCYERALTLYRSLGDSRGIVSSLSILAEMGADHPGTPVVVAADDPDRSIRRAEEAVALAHEIGWASGEAYALSSLALCQTGQGSYGAALSAARAGLAIAGEIEHYQWMIVGRAAMAGLFLELSAPRLAQTELEQAQAIADHLESAYLSSVVNSLRASTLLEIGDLAQARSLMATLVDGESGAFDRRRKFSLRAEIELALTEGNAESALAIIDQFVDVAGAMLPRELISQFIWLARGRALSRLGRLDEADALLRSVLEAARARRQRPLLWRTHLARAELARKAGRRSEAAREYAAARSVVAELALELPNEPEALLEGRSLRAHFEAAALAQFPSLPAPSARQIAKESYGGLTGREREVAVLIAQGRSNREIAEALFIGERTVQTHIANIFAKLGVSARSQVAAWAVEVRLESASE